MVMSAHLFVSISIYCQTHSLKQYIQNLEQENPRTKIKKWCQMCNSNLNKKFPIAIFFYKGDFYVFQMYF